MDAQGWAGEAHINLTYTKRANQLHFTHAEGKSRLYTEADYNYLTFQPSFTVGHFSSYVISPVSRSNQTVSKPLISTHLHSMQLTCTVDLAEMRVCSDNSGQIYQTLFNKIRAPDRNEKGQNVIKIIVEI